MKTINMQSLMQRLLKQSDMPLFEGERDYKNRQGLHWQRLYMGGQFVGEGSLPPGASAKVQEMMAKFKASYSPEQGSTKGTGNSDFSGMLFVIYARDTIETPALNQKIPPQLEETMEFVRQNHIRMIQPGGPKGIGTPFWQSWNGQAYASLFPGRVEKVDASRAEQVVNLISDQQMESFRSNNWPRGMLTVMRTERGFGPFLVDGDQQFSILRDQESQNMRKFFVDKLQPNSSPVQLNGNQAVSVRQTKLRGGMATDPQAQQDRSERWERLQNGIASGNIYILSVDPSGALFGRRVTGLKGNNYVIDDKDTRYLTQQEVESIINPDKKIKPMGITPPIGEGKAGDKIGPWRFNPELAAALEEGGALADSPYSFQNLRMLREYADASYREQYGNEGPNSRLHTPYEGFKIIMIGPVSTNPEHAGGQTEISSPRLLDPALMVDPSQSQGQYAVSRDINWVVISNEVRPNAGAELNNPWTQVRGAGTSNIFQSAKEAVRYVMDSYVDTSISSNAQVLSDVARSVQVAENKLRSSSGLPPNPIMRPKQQQPAPQPPELQGPASQLYNQIPPTPQQSQQPQTQRWASSTLGKLFRRIKY